MLKLLVGLNDFLRIAGKKIKPKVSIKYSLGNPFSELRKNKTKNVRAGFQLKTKKIMLILSEYDTFSFRRSQEVGCMLFFHALCIQYNYPFGN